MEYNILDKLNEEAFVNIIAYKNAVQYLKNLNFSEENLTELIIRISRYTYTYCEETLLRDFDYDQLVNADRYSKYKNINYEEDKIDKNLLNVIKNLGLRTIEYDYSGVEYENELSDKEKQQLIGLFPQNTGLTTFKDENELRSSFIEPYAHNLGKVINIETEEEFKNIKDLTELGSLGVEEKYHIPGSDNIFMAFKHDGWNITAYYIPGMEKAAYSHTRGRDGATVRDCTHIAKKILPKMNVKEPTKLVFELVLDRTSLEKLRSKYLDKNFVNIRNSISSFISGKINEEDYSYLNYFAFNISNSEYDKMDTFTKYYHLHKLGFNIPEFQYGSIHYLSEMIQFMDNRYVEEYSLNWECDGLVITMDFLDYYNYKDKTYYKTNGMGICAYKGGTWGSEVIEMEVDYIYYGKGKKKLVPKAKLIPRTSKSGSIIENVGLDNLRLLGYFYIMPGDIIKVRYHSQQIVLFVNKVSGANKGQYLKKSREEIKEEISSYDKYREYRDIVDRNIIGYEEFKIFTEIVERLEREGKDIIKNCMYTKGLVGYPYEEIVKEYNRLNIDENLRINEDMWQEYAVEILYPIRSMKMGGGIQNA